MDLSKLVEWIKLSPKYLLGIALACGVLLFFPSAWVKFLGLEVFLSAARPWIGIVFVAAIVLVIVNIGSNIWIWVRNYVKSKLQRKRQIERLHKLTAEEKEILLGFILNKTRTQYLAYADGVVKGLEAERIIFESSNVGDLERWSYNIQPWAWNIINSNIKDFFTEEDIRAFEVSDLTPSQKSARRVNPLLAFSDKFRRR
jgi:superinfection exclusion protein B